MADEQPKKPRPGPSVYDLREAKPPRLQEPRRLASTDRDGVLRWREDWLEAATGWLPLDAFLRGRR